MLEMDDRIVWAPTGRGYWSPKNIDRSRDRGLESSVELEFVPDEDWKFGLRADHSYVDAQVIDQVRGEEEMEGRAIYVPPHRASGVLTVEYGRKNRLVYGVSHTGLRYIDRDNLRYLPGYTLQRIRLQRRLALRSDLGLTVQAGIRNLFDIPYHSVAWHPMPGRTFELTLRLRIGP
jgi:iron complex outermembrane receptor protein